MTGLRDARRDNEDPPPAQVPPSASDPHDEEHMDARPDQEEMEEAINNFLQQLDKQEKKGFKDLASLLSLLPKPAKIGSVRSISVPEAIEAGFLPAPDEAHGNMFTPSELRLCGHAQDHRLTRDILFYLVLSLHNLGYPILSQMDNGRTEGYDCPFEADGLRPCRN